MSGPIVSGRHFQLGRDTFASLVRRVQLRGYHPYDVTPEEGTFRVRSSWRSPSGERVVFEVRAYQEGWLQTRPVGALVVRRGTRIIVPAPVERELVTFAGELAFEANGLRSRAVAH
ncbi:MAG: hypothetical protein AB7S26_38760 [Sandaracinaceae bacterium]